MKMAIVKAQCPACGVVLDVEESGGAAVCSSCATPFVIAAAVDAYTHSMHGQTLEMGIKNGNTFLQLQEWDKARVTFDELTLKYPHDARTWLGIARSISQEQSCHTVTTEVLHEIQQAVYKARTINLYIADNSWDVYLENEEDRLNREAQQKEAMRRKLQREYDEVVMRSHRQLSTLVANKKAMRSTYITLGSIVLVIAAGLAGAFLLEFLSHIWYLYIAGGVAIIGLVLFVMGLCSRSKTVSLPGNDIEDIKRTVERIQQSAKRSGVTLDMSQKIKTFVAPRK